MTLVVALAAAFAPCALAFQDAPSCPMKGCDAVQHAALNRPCCCSPSAPATPAGTAPMIRVTASDGVLSAPSSGAVASMIPATLAREGAADPPLHVPLFLLHASLLI